MKTIRRIGYAVAGVAAFVVFAASAAIVLLEAGVGRTQLAAFAGRLLSAENARVSIGAIEGSLLRRFTIARVSVADADGAWLEAETIEIGWTVSALLGSRIEIDHIRIARVNVARQPKPMAPPPAARAPGDAESAFPSLPRLRVDELSVGAISVERPVIGTAVRARVSGTLDVGAPDAGIFARLEIVRVDGVTGRLRAELRYVRDSEALTLALDAEDAADGLLAHLTGAGKLAPLFARISGEGTLRSWSGTADAAIGGEPLLRARLDIREDGADRLLRFTADLTGARALPAPWSEALAASAARAQLRWTPGRRLAIERAEASAAGIRFDADGGIAWDSSRVSVRFALRSEDSKPAAIFVPGIAWRRIDLTGEATGALAAPAIEAKLALSGLAFGANRTDSVTAEFRATPALGRAIRYSLITSGRVEGIETADTRLRALTAAPLVWSASASLRPDGDFALSSFTASSAEAQVSFTGQAARAAIDGSLKIQKLALAPLSALAGQDIAGVLDLGVAIQGRPERGEVALRLEGTLANLKTGVPAADPLVADELKISGAMRRNSAGAHSFQDVSLRGSHVNLALDGRLGPAMADLRAQLRLPDLAAADKRFSGSAAATVALRGPPRARVLEAGLSAENVRALGRTIDRLAVTLVVANPEAQPSGRLAVSGRIDGTALDGRAEIASDEGGAVALDAIALRFGNADLAGRLRVENGIAGQLDLTVPELREFAALLPLKLAGRLQAGVRLSVGADGAQRAALAAAGSTLSLDGIAVGEVKLDGEVRDPLGMPAVKAEAVLRRLRAGAVEVATARIKADGTAQDIAVAVETAVAGADVRTAARISLAAVPTIRLEQLRIAAAGREVRLASPTTITLPPQRIVLAETALVSGAGSVRLRGEIGEASDLGIELRAFPLSAAAIVAPGFAPEGAVSGTIRVGGPMAAPVARYELAVSRFSSDELDSFGAGPVTITARGTATPERVDVTANLSGPARSTATVRGVVPLSGAGLALDIKGAFDLGMANALIAARGMRVSGPVTLDLAATGSLANPRLAGNVRLTGGRFEDPVNGLLLERIALTARAEGDVLTVTQFSGATANGGTLTGSGNVTLRPDQGFPGRFELRTDNAQLVSSEIVTAVADARIEISGALARRPRLSGRIDVRNMDVKIPDRMPGAAARIDVRHVNVPAGLRRHLPAPPKPRGAQGPAFKGDIDLVVAAPVRVFVRGRGVDAEFGGELAIRGDTDAPTVNGGFDLKRGTLDVLGRRLTFSRGRITFANNLDPALDFVADARAGDIVAAVTVSGTASDPKFEFKSTPELPQDEVMARLLFGRPSAQLTTSQAVRLAQAVAQLSGGGDSELLDRIRRNLGVDTIDVGGDDTGAPRVGLGRRIGDRVYLGVTQGATPGSSGAKVRVDITPNVRVESEVGADRSNSIGIGAEWDY